MMDWRKFLSMGLCVFRVNLTSRDNWLCFYINYNSNFTVVNVLIVTKFQFLQPLRIPINKVHFMISSKFTTEFCYFQAGVL